MGEVRLEIPARPEYLGLARQVVAAAAAIEATFRPDRIDDLRVVVSEATTNAIEAHADLDRDERIVIRSTHIA
jgi:anti-sigma regulatory factor (Ser/Thr protein kinase)